MSWSIDTGDARYFIKTAGVPGDDAYLSHAERMAVLHNAIRLGRRFADPVLPALRNVIESPHGPMLVYDWVKGELVGVPVARREDPRAAFMRFKMLPLPELTAALGEVFRFHRDLCAAGWIANDFYDGAMIYDFEDRTIKLIDLDLYRDGPFINSMGKMFGSTRFMAPEEFELGAEITECTTVFTMGRCIQVFMGERRDGNDRLLDVADKASLPLPADRFRTMSDFYNAWCESLPA